MESPYVLRDAEPGDAPACAALYAPYVLNSAATFETDPPAPEEMRRRIAAAQERHAWLVAVQEGDVAGYAYAGAWRSRSAYRHTAETSIYLAGSAAGSGLGTMLYSALLKRLRERGYRVLVAGMTVPNPASEALHSALGFEPVGVFRRVGFKHGEWHDVGWMQLDLLPGSPPGSTG